MKSAILTVLNIEEERLNLIVLVFGIIADIASWAVVVGFLDGGMKDSIVLCAVPLGILLRILEKKVELVRKYAKYLYMLCPCFATVVVVVGNSGKYSAITQFYIMWMILAVAYCDVKMVYFYSATTIATNLGALIFFPEAMLKIDTFIIWFYILIIFSMEVILAAIIAGRLRGLIEQAGRSQKYEDELAYFEQLEKKEEKHSEMIHNLNHYFTAIGELAREEDNEQILKLTEELNQSILQNERIIYTSHKVANAILSEKAREAVEMGISFDIYVEPGVQFGRTSNSDLVAMLGNLAANALEAADRCSGDKRNVVLRIFMEKEGRVCVTKIVNYFDKKYKPVPHKGGFVTSKKNNMCGGGWQQRTESV